MKRIILVLVISGLLSLTAPVFADDAMVFDSTDNYLGACSFTDSSAWTLSENFTVSKFQIWYKWQTGETALPVTVYKDGVEFASFEAKRGDCDPYQTTWCNADYAINKDFSAGNYTTKIPAAYQCLKPGGTGIVVEYFQKDGGARIQDVAEFLTGKDVRAVVADKPVIVSRYVDTPDGPVEILSV